MIGESSRKRVMHVHALRALLLGSEDGLTAGEMARALGTTSSYTSGVLKEMYGCYVDRWANAGNGSDAAVWMCVPVPKNCPRPEKQDDEL